MGNNKLQPCREINIRHGERKQDVYILCVWSKFYGQATKGTRVDALAQVGDEGRGQLR